MVLQLVLSFLLLTAILDRFLLRREREAAWKSAEDWEKYATESDTHGEAARERNNALFKDLEAALAKAESWKLAAMTLGEQFQKNEATLRAVHAALTGDPSTVPHDPHSPQPDPEL